MEKKRKDPFFFAGGAGWGDARTGWAQMNVLQGEAKGCWCWKRRRCRELGAGRNALLLQEAVPASDLT